MVDEKDELLHYQYLNDSDYDELNQMQNSNNPKGKNANREVVSDEIDIIIQACVDDIWVKYDTND